MTDTTGADPITASVANWQRRHLRAAAGWTALLGLLLFLAFLQLLNPDMMGGRGVVSVGRLRVAVNLVALYGCGANLVLVLWYQVLPGMARWMARWHLALLKFTVLNALLMPVALAMVLAGVLPPSLAQDAWMGLGHPMIVVPMVLFIWPVPLQGPWARVRWLFIAGGLALTAAMWLRLTQGFGASGWSLTVVGAVPILFGGLLGWVMLARSVPRILPSESVAARAGAWVLLVGLVIVLPLPFLADAQDDGPASMTMSERRGRETFIREGCVSCHQPFYANEIGRDLGHEFGARSADWHFTHLYSPRLINPTSPMPSFARYFDGAPDRPTQTARDLVAYLETFGRREELSTAPGRAKAPPESRARRTGDVPALPAGNRDAGVKLFALNCAGCHGTSGQGDGAAAPGLRPKPANLAAHRYTREQVAFALWNGMAGSAMPAWRNLPHDQLASLIEVVRGFGDAAPASNGATAAPAPGALEAGARVYAENCSQCHGEHGGGDGFSAASLAMAPANFQRQQPTLDYALRAIANGVEGTPMAPWTTRLSEEELLSVAHYVRSLYQGGAR